MKSLGFFVHLYQIAVLWFPDKLVGKLYFTPEQDAMETIFSLSFLLTGPFWAMMIFAPRWRWTQRLVGSPYIVLPATLLYIVLIVPTLVGSTIPMTEAFTLKGITELLSSDVGATVGWIHFLAFDLFVGRWAYLDGQERGISHWLLAPILFCILMVGPLGLTLYLVVRGIKSQAFPKKPGF
jgi:hypothetical protein